MRTKALRYFCGMFLVISFIICFALINEQINYNRKCEFEFVGDPITCAYQIEDVVVDDENLCIKGWFFELKSVRNELNEIDREKKLGIVLYDINSKEEKYIDGSLKNKKGIALNVERNIRTDVNDYYKCEYDYSLSGFEAKIKKTDIDIKDKQYQIVIKPDQDELSGIQAEAYLNNGRLQYVNPLKEMVLDVKGTDIEEIVNNGYCLVSEPKNNISVYQYEKKLYWITDSNYKFEEDGSTIIEYMMDTTQFDRLPKDRTEKGWFWGDFGGSFEDDEISEDINCGKYRVCVRKIPEEYSITRIVTGYYVDDQWVWQCFFRPVFLYCYKD